jgi:hypothetical protein
VPPRSDKSRRNVHQVQEMFTALGLPVCDDEAAIKAACEQQRGTRNRELNSTKGSVAARAQQWFDDVNAMLNKRDELLQIVFEEFCRLGDTVLRADIDGGRTALGADTQISLRDIAMNWCRARSDLANRWLAEYLEMRGLKDNEALEQPKRICEFKAVPRSGRVILTWTAPDDHYDEVRIVRVTDSSNDPSDEVVVYQGEDSSFLDTSVSPKVPYTYRAYTVFEGHRSLTASVAHTHRKSADSKGSRTSFVAVLLVVGCLGLVSYDHLMGDDIIMSTLARSIDQAANAMEKPGLLTRETEDALNTVQAPVNTVVEVSESPAVDSASPVQVLVDENGEPRPDPRAWMTRPPTLAFAGESLGLELAMTEQLEPELVDAVLVGVAMKRVEFDIDPPVVRLMVLPLPNGESEGEASWSFRLTSADGRLTEVIEGTCQVLH